MLVDWRFSSRYGVALRVIAGTNPLFSRCYYRLSFRSSRQSFASIEITTDVSRRIGLCFNAVDRFSVFRHIDSTAAAASDGVSQQSARYDSVAAIDRSSLVG